MSGMLCLKSSENYVDIRNQHLSQLHTYLKHIVRWCFHHIDFFFFISSSFFFLKKDLVHLTYRGNWGIIMMVFARNEAHIHAPQVVSNTTLCLKFCIGLQIVSLFQISLGSYHSFMFSAIYSVLLFLLLVFFFGYFSPLLAICIELITGNK